VEGCKEDGGGRKVGEEKELGEEKLAKKKEGEKEGDSGDV
jgi:hypothetical protein